MRPVCRAFPCPVRQRSRVVGRDYPPSHGSFKLRVMRPSPHFPAADPLGSPGGRVAEAAHRQPRRGGCTPAAARRRDHTPVAAHGRPRRERSGRITTCRWCRRGEAAGPQTGDAVYARIVRPSCGCAREEGCYGASRRARRSRSMLSTWTCGGTSRGFLTGSKSGCHTSISYVPAGTSSIWYEPCPETAAR